MKISKKQKSILMALKDGKKKYSYRDLAKICGHKSHSHVSHDLHMLEKKGFVVRSSIGWVVVGDNHNYQLQCSILRVENSFLRKQLDHLRKHSREIKNKGSE